MRCRLLVAGLLAAGWLPAQPGWVGTAGTTPRPKPDAYPVHTALAKADLAAEFMLHSFSGAKGMYYTQDYLVVEVAVYPSEGEPPLVDPGQFALRLNGKKDLLLPQGPEMVAASLRYPDWSDHPQVVASAGTGAGEVVLGPPAPVSRFPGDPGARPPRPLPRSPEPDNPSGLDPQPAEKAEDVAVAAGLASGQARGPVSGYLYFAYSGKSKKIKSLELLYTGTLGSATLKLR